MSKTIKLSNMGVIMLGVRDLKKSVEFYKDVLGLPVLGTGGVAFLNAGAVTLGLRICVDLKESSDDRRVELVFNVDDIDAAYESLNSRGVKFARAPRIVTGQQYAADFRDPDGQVLSIFGARGA